MVCHGMFIHTALSTGLVFARLLYSGPQLATDVHLLRALCMCASLSFSESGGEKASTISLDGIRHSTGTHSRCGPELLCTMTTITSVVDIIHKHRHCCPGSKENWLTSEMEQSHSQPISESSILLTFLSVQKLAL